METVTMSYEELDRVSVIERVIEKRLTQREAARMLGLTSRRQVCTGLYRHSRHRPFIISNQV